MRLLLGVTGGIAAYKAADLVSKAVKAGFEVRVVMTTNATRFVAPLTFEALSGQPVLSGIWDAETAGGPSSIAHIAWAKWAEVACIAPLTASTLARLTHGFADDALTTVWLALPATVPSLLCPAMNTEMWNNPAVRRNVDLLTADGRHTLLPPVSKRLACGDVGPGALAETDDILAALQDLVRAQSTGA
jgi:phosphopantothenoylcysteine decarboxylase/phosphopantothenate--cysteine ligase